MVPLVRSTALALLVAGAPATLQAQRRQDSSPAGGALALVAALELADR